MSQLTSSQSTPSFDFVPSRYTIFEQNINGVTSSPQSPKQKAPPARSDKKVIRFSEIAHVGEAPNLKDVSISNHSKAGKSLSLSKTRTDNVPCGETTKGAQSRSQKINSSSSPNNNINPCLSAVIHHSNEGRTNTIDLFTESVIEPSGYGEANALRLQSSSEPPSVTDAFPRVPCPAVERSVRKAAEWVNSIPDRSDLDDLSEDEAVIVRGASQKDDTQTSSILLVAPNPRVREVRIVLQRLDPQMLLQVPIEDIQNLLKERPSFRQIKHTMDNLIASSKIGVIPLQGMSPRSNMVRSNKKDNAPGVHGENVPSSQPVNSQRPKKRKLLEFNRQLSDFSEEISVDSSLHINVNYPYSPPRKKLSQRKPKAPVKAKKVQHPAKKGNTKTPHHSTKTNEAGQSNIGSQNVPETRPPDALKTQTTVQTKKRLLPVEALKDKRPVVCLTRMLTRTRSSDETSRSQNTLQTQSSVASSDHPRTQRVINNQKVPKPRQNKNQSKSSNVLPRRHEMTLRSKSTSFRSKSTSSRRKSTSSRRSSFLFQKKCQPKKKKNNLKRQPGKKTLTIVCTFLHRGETEMVSSIVKKLGGAVETTVTAKTTHVVCGGPKRTINVLRGIVRGCWLVGLDWVITSAERGKWLDEEPFELTSFSPAVQKCRIAKETLGIQPSIFKNVGPIFVGPKTAPPRTELCELILLSGGKIVSTSRRAQISVGSFVPNITSVSEKWVLDSIQENFLMPFLQYRLTA